MIQLFSQVAKGKETGAPLLSPADVLVNVVCHNGLHCGLPSLEELVEPITILFVHHIELVFTVCNYIDFKIVVDLLGLLYKVRGSWGRRQLAMAGEVTGHGQAHPHSWSINIVSLRSKESEESHRSEWKTELLSMFLTVTSQHASGACRSHSRPVQNLREASQKYIELSPSTPPFLTLHFYEKDLTPTPNLLRISGRYSLCLGIFDTPSAWAYLFSPLKVIRVTGSVG